MWLGCGHFISRVRVNHNVVYISYLPFLYSPYIIIVCGKYASHIIFPERKVYGNIIFDIKSTVVSGKCRRGVWICPRHKFTRPLCTVHTVIKTGSYCKASLNNTIKTCTGKISTCVVGIYCTKVIDPIRAVPDTTGTVLPDAIPYKVKTPSAFIRPFGSTPGYSRFVFGRTYIPGFVYFNKVHHN